MMIDSFTGNYAFLSNFYSSQIIYEGQRYQTAEHAFQAAKAMTEYDRQSIRLALSPGDAKRLGRVVKIRPDWEQIKLKIMEDILRIKFGNDALAEQLKATGSEVLVEGNWWGDTFWGVCNGVGENHLGKLLMKIREEL